MSTVIPNISFEYFPANTEVQQARLKGIAQRLDGWQPDFVSVTYGAGGSSRKRTFDTVIDMNDNQDRRTAAHLTCIQTEIADVLELSNTYWQAGIRDIVALRGDARPEKSEPRHSFKHANDMVAALKAQHDFTLRVACYPEKHPEADSLESDIEALKKKLDAGADEAITQFFFDADTFLAFRDAAEKAGIDSNRIIAGILPIKHFGQLSRFAEKCNCHLPEAVKNRFEPLDDTSLQSIVSADFAASLCYKLRQEGVNKFHFYTLNDDTRPHLTLENLGWFPQTSALGADEHPTDGRDPTTRRTG